MHIQHTENKCKFYALLQKLWLPTKGRLFPHNNPADIVYNHDFYD